LKIVYSKVANLDLKEIYSFISQDSIKYARREVELIQTAIKKLKKEPFIGKQFEESDDEFTRELIYRNYRVIYEIDHQLKQIIILTVHHHSRLISNNPAFKDDA